MNSRFAGRRRRWLWWVIASVAVGSLFLLSSAARLGGSLIVELPISDPQAIVVLASHEWERLPAAAALARKFPNADVVLSMPGTVNESTCYQCSNRPWVLAENGVAPQRIRIMPRRASNTFEEALAAADFCIETGIHRLVIVTSPYHTRRAYLAFRQAFRQTAVEIGVVPATREAGAQPGSWWRHGYDRAYVLYETAALVSYWFKNQLSPDPATPGTTESSLPGHR